MWSNTSVLCHKGTFKVISRPPIGGHLGVTIYHSQPKKPKNNQQLVHLSQMLLFVYCLELYVVISFTKNIILKIK